MDLVVCRYGEIALKGRNRGRFESQLISNIYKGLRYHNIDAKVRKLRGRILVFTKKTHNAVDCLRKVFGLVSVSEAVECPADIDKMRNVALDLLNNKEFETFRITTRRTDKDFPLTSNETDVDVGAFIVEKMDKKVKLKQPDINLEIEIHKSAYIFSGRVAGPGGIPVGMSGKVLCFVQKDEDLLAPWLMMKRGCEVIIASTEDIDIALLKDYYFGDIESVKIKDVGELTTIKETTDSQAIVLPTRAEGLIKNPAMIDKNHLVLYPLVSFDDKKAEELLMNIRR